MTHEQINEAYKPRIIVLLTFLQSFLNERGYSFGEPEDVGCDDYKYRIFDEKNKIGIDVEICLSEDFGDDPGGVNFALNVEGIKGEILSIRPYNYTPQCWVDRNDDEAVKERWHGFANLDWKNDLAKLISL